MELAAVLIIIGAFAVDRLVRPQARVVQRSHRYPQETDDDARPR